jgi:macrolide transport system ATP-binding/permease protein
MLRAGNVDLRASAFAVSSDIQAIFKWEMARGVFFNREDERHLATVIVLSQNIRRHLFGDENAIGRHVPVDNVPFLVIGELTATSRGRGQQNGRVALYHRQPSALGHAHAVLVSGAGA